MVYWVISIGILLKMTCSIKMSFVCSLFESSNCLKSNAAEIFQFLFFSVYVKCVIDSDDNINNSSKVLVHGFIRAAQSILFYSNKRM